MPAFIVLLYVQGKRKPVPDCAGQDDADSLGIKHRPGTSAVTVGGSAAPMAKLAADANAG